MFGVKKSTIKFKVYTLRNNNLNLFLEVTKVTLIGYLNRARYNLLLGSLVLKRKNCKVLGFK